MRQIHPVKFHERFGASGQYVYEQDGKPGGIHESWTIHHLPDASRLVRVDHDARKSAFGTSLLLEALVASGRIQRFDLQFFNPNGSQVKQARASYQLSEDRVHVSRQINTDWQPLQEILLPPGRVIYPSMCIFTGSVIRQILEQGGREVAVLTPDIAPPDLQGVLAPELDYRSAELVGTETLNQAGNTTSAAHYRFIGSNYNPECSVWLDDHDILIAYQYQSWRVYMKQYARSHDF